MIDTQRNMISAGGFVMYPVEQFSVFQGFDCNHAYLNSFLHSGMAEYFAKNLLGVTYALETVTEAQQGRCPLAFATLMNDAIFLDPSAPVMATSPTTFFPAVKIARMGVQGKLQGRKLGSFLLQLMRYLFRLDNRTGCRLITVDAFYETVGFYQKNGFAIFPGQEIREGKNVIFYYDLLCETPTLPR